MSDDSSDPDGPAEAGSEPTAESTDVVAKPNSRSTAAPEPPRFRDATPGGDSTTRARTESGGSPSPFSMATARIRRDPTLLVPFALAGVVLTLVDWARRLDPLPSMGGDGGDGLAISVEFVGYPTGVQETARSLAAHVDLKLPYLAWAIGLEAVALLAVAVAGAVTIARALSADIGSGSGASGLATERGWIESLSSRDFLAYLGLVVLIHGVGRALGSIGRVGLLVGLPILVIVFAALVRFFAAPAFAATGAGPIAALRRSARATRGSGWSILALVLLYGLSAGLLASVPYAGTFLSTALVAPIHAVSTATVREAAADDDPTAREGESPTSR